MFFPHIRVVDTVIGTVSDVMNEGMEMFLEYLSGIKANYNAKMNTLKSNTIYE